MSRPVALRIVRAAAADSRQVVWVRHAIARMRQRRITPVQVLSCLARGVITEGPARDVRGAWRCTVERLAAGQEIKVVVALDDAGRVIVISVM